MGDYDLLTEPNIVTQADAGPALSWETDASRRCNYFNEAFLEFTGLSVAELSGDQWTTIVHPDDLNQLLKASGEAFELQLPFALEARFRRHDDVYRWFLNVGTPKFSKTGVFTGHSGTNFDISKSKQIELARLDEQHRLHSILEHSSTMIAQLDTEFHYVYANVPYASFWDETPQSLIGRYMLIMAEADQIADARNRFADSAKGLTVAFEFKATRAGKARTLLVKYVRNMDAQGELLGYYVFADDITEIREKQKHFELILNHLPADVAYFNHDMEFQYGNRAFLQSVGTGPGGIKGRKMSDVIGVAKHDLARNHIRKAIQGETVFFERTESDQHSLVYLIPNLDSKNRTTGLFTLELDVSALKRAEAKLRKSDRQFELALQGSQVGFWETGLAGHDTFLTENIESLLGLPSGKLGNSREAFYQRIHPDDINRVRKTDQLQLVEPSSHLSEYRLLMADDRYSWFRSIGESEQDANGDYVRSAGTITNINNLKNAELEAAAQVRNRDVFMSMLSHELRNPLSAISFAVDYLRESGTLSEEHLPMFDIIARQTDQTSRMLADLLDVTRIAGDQLLFEKEPLDLTELLKTTAAATQHLFDRKGQSFEVNISSGLTTFGDKVRLQQAITNLLDNASKYSPENGAIRLSASMTDNHSLPQSSQRSALDSNSIRSREQLSLTIEDDGRGISKEDQVNIFELFFQKERAIDRSQGGLGLGLHLVREITIAHGGNVTVESSGEGQGSRFVIRLMPTALQTLSRPQHKTADLSTCKVVLVEDNRDALLALTHTLMARGCEVISYSDGVQASENLPTDKPDFAIIDIGLPNKNGLELMTEMRDIASLKRTVFIALTGYGQSSDRRDIAAAGFEAHLVKPVDTGQLLQMLADRHTHQPATPAHHLHSKTKPPADEVRVADLTAKPE